MLDQLVSSLLDRQKNSPISSGGHSTNPRESTKLSRLKSLSFRNRRSSNKTSGASTNELNLFTSNNNGFVQQQPTTTMPTILESGSGSGNVIPSTNVIPQQSTSAIDSSSLDRHHHRGSGVRQILNSIKNAPHRFSYNLDSHQRLNDEETNNLTKNMLD